MAKSVVKPTSMIQELSKWNFVIFLTLALMLIVSIVYSLSNVNFDVRSRAIDNSATR